MNDDAIKINPEDAEAYIEKGSNFSFYNGLIADDLENMKRIWNCMIKQFI